MGERVTTDYYAVLGVRPNADADEIKAAYRRLARVLHPDVNPDPSAQEQFKEVTRAYQVLSGPGQRHTHDLGGDPSPGPGDYFRPPPRTPPARDYSYPQDRWESYRQRPPPPPAAGAWNGPRDQPRYSDYPGGQSQPFPYDWLRPPAPARAARPYRPHPMPLTVALLCAVFGFGVLVAFRVAAHHDRFAETRVTRMGHIFALNATWSPPLSDAKPTLTPQRAWQRLDQNVPVRHAVQLGVFTQPCGRSSVASGCGEPQLAYRFSWTACALSAPRPAGQCWNWVFVNANNGDYLGQVAYNGGS